MTCGPDRRIVAAVPGTADETQGAALLRTAVAGKITCPLLVMHGEHGRRAPVDDATGIQEEDVGAEAGDRRQSQSCIDMLNRTGRT